MRTASRTITSKANETQTSSGKATRGRGWLDTEWQGPHGYALLLSLAFLACSSEGRDRYRDGALSMRLSTNANGTTYRLRDALFDVSGPEVLTLHSKDGLSATGDAAASGSDPGCSPGPAGEGCEEAIQQSLVVGDYGLSLRDGWQLEREFPSGFQSVQALLVSPNPTAFSIFAGQTTNVAYAFETDGTLVQLGEGDLNLTITVTDTSTPPLCAAGQTACNGAMLQRCNEGGTGFQDEQNCGTAAQCNSAEGTCADPCVLETARCNGSALEECRSLLEGWRRFETCVTPELCNAAQRRCDAPCNLGALQCNGLTLNRCDATRRFTFAQNCNDGNACTTDSCNVQTGCGNPPLVCNDNNACTTNSCNPATGCTFPALACNDNNACTADTCNAATGCTSTPSNGVPCAAGVCANRLCVECDEDADCADTISCTADSCNAAGSCVHTPSNALCANDTNACNGVSTCNVAAGGCVTSAPVVCPNDNNACNGVSTCNPVNGNCATSAPVTCPDDDNACNGVSTCVPSTGTCVTSAPVSCPNNNNACDGVSTCNPANGSCVTSAPVTCRDADADVCTGVPACDRGTGECVTGPAQSCPAGECFVPSCDRQEGCLDPQPAAPDTPCTGGTCDGRGTCVLTAAQ